MPPVDAVIGVPYTYPAGATDRDGDAIVFALAVGPTGMTVDAATGVVAWLPGAGQTGVREGREFVVDGSLDFTVRKHALRTGLLLEAGQWDSTQQTNANGTFTFSSLEDFERGLARTFTRRAGDPRVSYTQYQVGWYVQDDFRLSKNLQVSLGLRPFQSVAAVVAI